MPNFTLPINLALGLPIEHLDYQLAKVSEEMKDNPQIDEGWHRLNRDLLEQFDRTYEVDHGYSWENRKHYLEYDLMRSAFSIDELAQWWWNSYISSEVSEAWEKDESPFCIVKKIHYSLWNWGRNHNYNHLAGYYECLKQFRFGSLEVNLDWTGSTYGYSRLARIYLDGTIGYLIHDRGKHQLTVSFGLSKEGLLLCQVQLAQTKGNRWLYRLKEHYLDYTIDRLQDAFPNYPLWIVDGSDLAGAIHKSYIDEKPADDTFQRIQSFYDRPLQKFQRTDCLRSRERRGMRFWLLEPK